MQIRGYVLRSLKFGKPALTLIATILNFINVLIIIDELIVDVTHPLMIKIIYHRYAFE